MSENLKSLVDAGMQDTDDFSFDVETSVPTDLTVSSVSDDEKKRKGIKRNIDSYFKERRQLIHELQLLKIELSQKNLMIHNLKSDITAKTEILEEKLADAIHQKQLSQAKLEAQLKLLEEEAKHRQTIMKNEIEMLQRKQQKNEVQMKEEGETSKNLKLSLDEIKLSENHFCVLRNQAKESLSLKDYVALKIYEYAWVYKTENDDLHSKIGRLQEQVYDYQKQLLICKENLEKEKEEHMQLNERYKKIMVHFTVTKSHFEHGNYAQENFDRVKLERDQLNIELLNANKTIDSLKTALMQVTQEKDDTKSEIVMLKHRQALLQQECEYLGRQVGDLTQRWGEAQDRASRLASQVDQAKASREELFERFINTRDKYKTEYEIKLYEEKSKITDSTTFFYEKEIRSLKEARDSALRQKEVADALAVDIRNKYEQLRKELYQKREYEDLHLKELQKKLSEKIAELQKCSLTLTTTETVLQEKQLENDKLSAKLEVLNQDIEFLKTNSNERLVQLETELERKKSQLEVFEKLETELNEVVNEAAQIVDEKQAENVITACTDQLAIPGAARFSFLRCVNLTRKVLQQERDISSLKRQLQVDKDKSIKLSNEMKPVSNKSFLRKQAELQFQSSLQSKLSESNKLLNQTSQPYSYLITAVRKRDSYIQELQLKIEEMEKQLESLHNDKDVLLDERSKLAADLERLLSHREEMAKMKQLFMSFYSKQENLPSGFTIDHSGHAQTQLMRPDVPEWYKVLRKQR